MTLPTFPQRSYAFAEHGPCRNLIGGAWRDASGGVMAIENPRHGRVMGTVALSGAADVDAAVQAARDAFPGWRGTPVKERVQVLYRLKRLMERDLDALSWLLSHENGKTFGQARGSVAKGIECLEHGISLANAATGRRLQVSRGVICHTVYEPLGVCAGIVPFNFPIMVPMWMLPQALIAGNAFVLKPSEQVPYGASHVAELLLEAGLPPGVLNLVQGGRAAAEALVEHPQVKALGFVGSSRVARIVYERGAALGKRVLCLGGAKNHLVVVPDADVALTAENVIASSMGCAGQRCMAAAVVLAVGDVQHIIDAMVQAARAIELGEGIGAIISQAAQRRITGYIDRAEAMGGRLLLDGRGARGPDPGYWIGPTIIDGVHPDWPIAQEEVFGPVLVIIRVDTVEQALAIENNNPYGNAAAVYTTSGEVAERCVEGFEAGMCGVNIGVPVPREPFAFGGWNQSKFGHGDLTADDGYRFWTRPRKVTTKWAAQADRTWMS